MYDNFVDIWLASYACSQTFKRFSRLKRLDIVNSDLSTSYLAFRDDSPWLKPGASQVRVT